MKKKKNGMKDRMICLRLTSLSYERLKSFAASRNTTVTALVTDVVLNYIDRDIDVTQQMMASTTRMHSEIKQAKTDIVLTYNLLAAFIYSYFCTTGKECLNEFCTKEYTTNPESLSKGLVARTFADKVMQMFMDKFMSAESVRNGMLSNLAEMMNPDEETKEK